MIEEELAKNGGSEKRGNKPLDTGEIAGLSLEERMRGKKYETPPQEVLPAPATERAPEDGRKMRSLGADYALLKQFNDPSMMSGDRLDSLKDAFLKKVVKEAIGTETTPDIIRKLRIQLTTFLEGDTTIFEVNKQLARRLKEYEEAKK